MIDKRLKLLLPSKPKSLCAIRKEMQNFIAGTPYEQRASDILVAVSEASANVVRHAYPKHHRNPKIILDLVLQDDCLAVRVADRGKGLSVSSPDPVFSEEGGFGLYLMRKLSDSFKCQSTGTGTVVELGFLHPVSTKQDAVSRGKWSDKLTAPTSWLACAELPITAGTGPSRGRVKVSSPPVFKSLKSHCYAFIAALFIKAKIHELRRALKEDNCRAARDVVDDIANRLRIMGWVFADVPPEAQEALKHHLEGAYRKMLQLKEDTAALENEEMPLDAGICVSVHRSEIAKLISTTAEYMNGLLYGERSCWLSLDEESVQLL